MDKTGIIIVNWNAGESILECIRHLVAQKGVEPKILVVDNNSSDGSVPAIRDRYPHIEILCNPVNAGFAAACNQGVSYLKDCRWIAILNPDAFPAPDWLQRLLSVAKISPEYCSFASLVLSQADPDVIDSAGDAYMGDGRGIHRLQGLNIAHAESRPVEVFAATGAAALYRRESLIKAEGFDERFFCYYEDIDLGFRLQLLGYRCLLVPDARVLHVGGGTTGGMINDYSLFYCQRNFIWSFFKNMPLLLMGLYLPLHIVYVLGGLARGYRLGKFRLILRATLQALRGLPDILSSRGKLHSGSRISMTTLRGKFGLLQKS